MQTLWQSLAKRRRGGLFLFAALALLLMCIPTLAQVTASSSLEGTVADIKQAVIPGASVTVTNDATGLTRTVQTNESGAYRFDLLPAGFYDIKISASGFGDVTSSKVELLVGKTSTFDFTMSPGGRTETVTVTSDAPLLDQQKTDVGQNITPREVEDLPLNGRDLGNLAYLAPGAQPVDSYDPTKNRIAVFGINGSSGRNVNVTVNGIDNKDNTVGGPVMQFALEAIQEFVISTQRFSAANGRSEGAAPRAAPSTSSPSRAATSFTARASSSSATRNLTPTISSRSRAARRSRRSAGSSSAAPSAAPSGMTRPSSSSRSNASARRPASPPTRTPWPS